MTAKVRELMTPDVASCRRDDNLAAAAKQMWDRDCGILPVLDEAGHVMGVVTDRDICMAVATRDRLASRITVGEVTSGRLVGVGPEDGVHDALARMRAHRVRRLPVVDDRGLLLGLLSLNDVILFAEAGGLPAGDITETLRAICAHRDVVVVA
ncbi:MAG: CBS domain-containing protein [Vicinamibacterales bacterium]